MNLDFIKTVKAEDYVSPSLELTTVGTEKGFCASDGIKTYHEGFGEEFESIN